MSIRGLEITEVGKGKLFVELSSRGVPYCYKSSSYVKPQCKSKKPYLVDFTRIKILESQTKPILKLKVPSEMIHGELVTLTVEIDRPFDMLEVIELKKMSTPMVDSDLVYPDGLCIHETMQHSNSFEFQTTHNE